MTRKIELSQAQIEQIQKSNEATCTSVAVPTVITDQTSFVFFGAFDGTNNDKDSVPRGALCTNVAQLWGQYERQRSLDNSGRFGGGYYKGPGSPGTLSESAWLPDHVKEQVIKAAADAYHDFCRQASACAGLKAVSVVITSFSRGAASAAVFCQMLYEKGLIHPDTKAILIPPKQVPVVGGLLFDPVMTGVNTTLALPPNVKNVVDLRALNEYRYLFKGADYTNHPESVIKTFGVFGNHCDVGGGYDNGSAGLTLMTATRVLKQLGLIIADVPLERTYAPDQIAVHTEEYDDYGKKIWDVSNEDGFSFSDLRQMVGVGSPFGPDLSGRNRFVMYNGNVIY